jgi:hypothetical protein
VIRSPLALVVLLIVMALPASAAAQMTVDQRNHKLGQAWQWMEAGSLDKADAAFKEVLADPKGKMLAEVHYGVAVVWWQKRNAMAAYQRLVDAAGQVNAPGWDAGEGKLWDARIKSRVAFIEKNFTAIKMKAESTKIVAPLADPSPKDPMILEFTNAMTKSVAETVAEGTSTLWMFLPNGQYWVGDDLLMAEDGEMDASRAGTWQLPKRTGAAKAKFESRQKTLAAGRSPAAELAAGGAAKEPKEKEPKKPKEPKEPVEMTHRAFAFGFQGGLAPTRALSGVDASVAADWTLGAQLEGRLALPPSILALAVGASWKLLPVNGCRLSPTRGHLAAVHVGPALQLPISGPAFLSVDAVVRGGLLVGGRSSGDRQACATAIVTGDAEAGSVARGAKVTSDGKTGVLTMADLGWTGRGGAIGGELAAGLVLDGGGPMAFGVQLVFTYDHIIPTLPGDAPETVWIRDASDGSITALTSGAAASAAAMGRMQAGLRLRLLL